MDNVIDVLKARGFIEALTSEELRTLVQQPQRIYCGFDPTSDSLHLGNMVPIMGLAWWQRFGHTPVVLLGGATGMIGDPSGRNSERSLLDEEILRRNIAGIRADLEVILDPNHPKAPPVYLNNYDWFKQFSMLDFLRDVGKYFRIGPMLGKDSVRNRMTTEEGMSFTEFSYQLLQGYDFYYLFKEHGVKVQLGGSDQWGNITAGTDLVRKITGETVYGVTFPLLTRSDGQKFGKSESGAIWLSPQKISPYEFYQYLVRIPDADVIKLMKLLTFMELEEIQRYQVEMQRLDYQPNTAQKRLAEEITRLVHHEDGLKKALQVTEVALPGSAAVLDEQLLESLAGDMPNVSLPVTMLVGELLIDIMVKAELQESKSAARKLIRNGGAYLNNEKIASEEQRLSSSDIIGGRLFLLAAGKKNKLLVRVEE